MEAKITHIVSSAYNPEGNGEAERNVGKVKHAIAHAGDKLESINAIVANLNTDQRTDGSGSAAELFLQRTLRVPGLAHIPSHTVNTDKEKEARVRSREKQVQLTKSQRRPDVFNIGQRVMVQNNVSKLWNIKGTIVSRREHQGFTSNSYVIRISRTGRQVCRSERHLRAIPTNSDTNGVNIGNDDTANGVFISSTEKRLRPAIKSSSAAQSIGGENSAGGKPSAPALELRAAPGTGSVTEASLAPATACQPLDGSTRERTVLFSEVVQIFDPEGEDHFDKHSLIQIRKTQGEPFKDESYTESCKQAVQEALSGSYEQTLDKGEALKGNERGPQVCGDGGGTVPRCRGDQCPRPPRQGQPNQYVRL